MTYQPTTLEIAHFKKDNTYLSNIKESQRRRGKSISIVDKIVLLNENYRFMRKELDLLNGELNIISKSCSKEKDTDKMLILANKGKELKQNISTLEIKVQQALHNRDDAFYTIGNLVHPSIPISMDETNNNIIKVWGDNRPTTPDLKHHHELLYMIGGYNPEMGAEVAGHRGYYLTGMGFCLNNALIQYGLQFLNKRKYTLVQTPFLMKQEMMKKVASLAEFDEALYKVAGNTDDEPMYLIATSEQPLCALNMNKSFSKKELPIKYCGYSTNFRKEAGSHGKDAWGLFRVHQFEKIEQFVLCDPQKSWDMQLEMLKVSEEFYESLNLPYHVVDIVTGELNNAAARKYDLEAWFPTLGRYRELVSCSNCTDYQSKRLNIKMGGSNNYVHMLNSTLTASERALCCILENYQTNKGIKIPDVLKPFMSPYVSEFEDPDVIPFIKELPKNKNKK